MASIIIKKNLFCKDICIWNLIFLIEWKCSSTDVYLYKAFLFKLNLYPRLLQWNEICIVIFCWREIGTICVNLKKWMKSLVYIPTIEIRDLESFNSYASLNEKTLFNSIIKCNCKTECLILNGSHKIGIFFIPLPN